jgi:hypothetical protein
VGCAGPVKRGDIHKMQNKSNVISKSISQEPQGQKWKLPDIVGIQVCLKYGPGESYTATIRNTIFLTCFYVGPIFYSHLTWKARALLHSTKTNSWNYNPVGTEEEPQKETVFTCVYERKILKTILFLRTTVPEKLNIHESILA